MPNRPRTTDGEGCYRCGRSLVAYDGRRYDCPNCTVRVCEACMEVLKQSAKKACPKCDASLQTFKVVSRRR